jgi:hypothetical protein
MTDTWDPSIPRHKEIAHGIEVGDGIPEMRTIAQARKALKAVGFEVEYEEDLADRPDPVPWYYPLEGDLSKAQTPWDLLTVWRIHWSGRFVTRTSMHIMEFIGLIPKGTSSVALQLETAMTYLVEGGQKKVHLNYEQYLITILLTSTIALYTNVHGHRSQAFQLKSLACRRCPIPFPFCCCLWAPSLQSFVTRIYTTDLNTMHITLQQML